MIIEFFLLFIFFSSPFENKIWIHANTIFKNMIQSCCLMKPVRHKISMFPFRCNATMTISLFDGEPTHAASNQHGQQQSTAGYNPQCLIGLQRGASGCFCWWRRSLHPIKTAIPCAQAGRIKICWIPTLFDLIDLLSVVERLVLEYFTHVRHPKL